MRFWKIGGCEFAAFFQREHFAHFPSSEVTWIRDGGIVARPRRKLLHVLGADHNISKNGSSEERDCSRTAVALQARDIQNGFQPVVDVSQHRKPENTSLIWFQSLLRMVAAA